MDVRRRIAAIALFGVQLLQGVFPAAGVDCERHAVAVTAPLAALSAEVASAHAHHGAQAVVSTGAPMSAPVQHRHAPAACPMAMACTVLGVMSSAVAVSTVDLGIDVHRTVHLAEWPVSLDVAPEPPPPRG